MLWTILALAAALFVASCGWTAYTSSVETPDYSVVRADGDIELRAYPALLAAEVTRSGPRGDAANNAFSPLAGYIFAKKREGEKIAMTAPVTQSGSEDGWTVRFIMPSQYTRETLPAPAAGDVRIVEIPPRQMAAIRFSGRWSDEKFAQKEAALRAWLNAQGLPSDGEATFAYYNDPFTLPFMRRNEVLIAMPGA